jgi:hypothetical protein
VERKRRTKAHTKQPAKSGTDVKRLTGEVVIPSPDNMASIYERVLLYKVVKAWVDNCENIPLCCDSAFAHKKEFSIFKFPERFLEISCRDLKIFSLFFDNSNHLKDLVIRIFWTLVMSLSYA